MLKLGVSYIENQVIFNIRGKNRGKFRIRYLCEKR